MVEPPDSSSGLSTNLNLSGEGFEAGALVHLEDEGSASSFTAEADVSSLGDSASITIPPGLAASSYDVRLENPGGATGDLADAFTMYEGGVEITFLDVGHGDATLVRSPRGDTLLKDGGRLEPGRDSLLPFLEDYDALPPTNIIVSHRHEDHLGGIVAVLEGPDGVAGTGDDGMPAGVLLHNDPVEPCTSPMCNRYDAVSRGPARVAEIDEVIDLGAGVSATVVAVSGHLAGGIYKAPDCENSSSVAIVIQFGDLRVFVGGDLTGGGFETIDMETPLSAGVRPIHVLRTNHHGSASSTNIAFTRNLSPAAAVISIGTNNPYCHPHRQVLSNLEQVGTRIFLTNPGVTHPTPECSEPTELPASSVVSNGHIRLESEDGQDYTLGPLDGSATSFSVP